MKIKILSALALASLVFTACDDNDKDVNTASGVTVSMKENAMRCSEDFVAGNYYSMPIVVDGDANGPIYVTIECAESDPSNPVTEPEHYVFTSKTIVIPADKKVANFQFYGVGDDVINEDRQFIATITDVKGATVGADKTCVVTLVDNEGMIPRAYQDLQGLWTASINSHFEGGVFDTPVVINGVEEGEEGFNSVLKVIGIPDEYCEMSAKLLVDGATGAPTLQFSTGEEVGAGNFSFGYGVIKTVYAEGTGFWPSIGPFFAVGNAEHSTVLEFNYSGYPGIGFLIYLNGSPAAWYDSCYDITLKR